MALSDESTTEIARPDVALERLMRSSTAPVTSVAEARLAMVVVWLVQEVDRLTRELNELTDYVVEDQRFEVIGETHAQRDPGADGDLHGSSGPAAFADHDARI